MVPQYNYRPHATIDEFANTLKSVFDIIDHAGKLQITGGEPLMHSNLPEMIEQCFLYSSQFDSLVLFTNCTIPFSKRLLNILRERENKVVVHASDYGLDAKNVDSLIALFVENGIDYRYLKYFGDDQHHGGWVDQGDFVKHNRSLKQLAEIFSICPNITRGGSWYVRGGQMHWCGRSIRGTEVGKVPLRSDDYLDVFSGTITERRNKFQKLRKTEYIIACDYCNGVFGTENSNFRRAAGIQSRT